MKSGKIDYKPVIIIGAPRSGTNMLRDLLCGLPGVGTWPCDEINYIWRHGNVAYPSDAFPAELATKSVSMFIRGKFESLAKARNLNFVVEKTCANSLRVPFVNRILPDAKYIYIVRDGVDVVASAMKRWQASLDLAYILRKARFVPLSDLPHYAMRSIGNRAYRLISGEKRLAFWGPRLDNMEKVIAGLTLSEICAVQWKECVSKADQAFNSISPKKVFRLYYESFVEDPKKLFPELCHFLGISPSTDSWLPLIGNISSSSVGKGHRSLNASEKARIYPIIGDILRRHGYS